jgi:hypothetical protein
MTRCSAALCGQPQQHLCERPSEQKDGSYRRAWRALSRKAFAAFVVEKTAAVNLAPGRADETSLPPYVAIKGRTNSRRRCVSTALPGTFVTTFLLYHGKRLLSLGKIESRNQSPHTRTMEK